MNCSSDSGCRSSTVGCILLQCDSISGMGPVMRHYHINVFYSEKDKCYVADIPDLKYCSALSGSPEEAVREVQIAKTAWLKAARQRKKRIPKARYRPIIYLQPFSDSLKFNFNSTAGSRAPVP